MFKIFKYFEDGEFKYRRTKQLLYNTLTLSTSFIMHNFKYNKKSQFFLSIARCK